MQISPEMVASHCNAAREEQRDSVMSQDRDIFRLEVYEAQGKRSNFASPFPIAHMIRGALQEPFKGSMKQADFFNEFVAKHCNVESAETLKLGFATIAVRGSGCGDAEDRFIETVQQIATDNHDKEHRQPTISVFHDMNGAPLLLQKEHSDRSAMLLQAAYMADYLLPAGTIVSIKRELDWSKKARSRKVGDGRKTEYVTQDIGASPIRIHPLRLSAYSFTDTLDRASFSIDQKDGSSSIEPSDVRQDRLVRLLGQGIDDFYDAAAKLVATVAEADK